MVLLDDDGAMNGYTQGLELPSLDTEMEYSLDALDAEIEKMLASSNGDSRLFVRDISGAPPTVRSAQTESEVKSAAYFNYLNEFSKRTPAQTKASEPPSPAKDWEQLLKSDTPKHLLPVVAPTLQPLGRRRKPPTVRTSTQSLQAPGRSPRRAREQWPPDLISLPILSTPRPHNQLPQENPHLNHCRRDAGFFISESWTPRLSASQAAPPARKQYAHTNSPKACTAHEMISIANQRLLDIPFPGHTVVRLGRKQCADRNFGWTPLAGPLTFDLSRRPPSANGLS